MYVHAKKSFAAIVIKAMFCNSLQSFVVKCVPKLQLYYRQSISGVMNHVSFCVVSAHVWHKASISAGYWECPALQFALDSFQVADRLEQQLFGFCGYMVLVGNNQGFPHGPNSSGTILVFIIGVIKLKINSYEGHIA